MTIQQALGAKTADIELLVMLATRHNREFLYTHPHTLLTPAQQKRLNKLISLRNKGVPYAYLAGKKGFYGREFFVTTNTLIPRPETETLIDLAKEIIQTHNIRSVLDVGTGSGCIAITLKKELPNLDVAACDISLPALKVARKNARQHKAKVSFYHSNLLENTPSNLDLIIANLPYVPAAVYKHNKQQLKYEPKIALVDKPQWPLTQKLIKQAQQKISPDGIILLEHDPSAMSLVSQFCKSLGKKVKVINDLQKIKRYIIIK